MNKKSKIALSSPAKWDFKSETPAAHQTSHTLYYDYFFYFRN